MSRRAIGEVREHIERLERRFGHDPDAHLRALFHLALEREQIVAVSYDEEVLGRRIEALQVPDDTRELVRHALRWIWKEEQMHAMHIRGQLLEVGAFHEQVAAIVHQLSGALGGWTTSVLHHTQWRQAPLSRMAAWIVTQLASWLGKLPESVEDELRYVSFRDYCSFAVNAELTAVICWQRMHELAVEHSRDARDAAAYARMSADEHSHSEIFSVFVNAFDEQGRLAQGWTGDKLQSELAAIGDYILPRAFRPDADDNPLGAGGVVAVVADTREVQRGAPASTEHEKRQALRRAIAQSGLADALEARRMQCGKAPEACLVAIKATFMLGYSRRDPSSIADPVLVHELCVYLRELGYRDIRLLGGRNLYDWYFDGRQVRHVAQYFGFDFPEATIVDCRDEMVEHAYRRASAHHEVPQSWRDADFRISFGKMRSHPVEQVYLTLGQLEGLTTRCEQFVFIDRRAHTGPALMTLLADFPPHFAFLDAYDHTPDGLLGMLASPAPLSPKRIYAGRDALSVDIVAARHMGVIDPDESQFLETAIDWYGHPRNSIEINGHNTPIEPWRSPCHNEFTAILSFLSFPVYVLLSGRGTLFVPEMDPEAFPAKGKVGWWLRNTRRLVRWLLDMRAPEKALPPSADPPALTAGSGG